MGNYLIRDVTHILQVSEVDYLVRTWTLSHAKVHTVKELSLFFFSIKIQLMKRVTYLCMQ